jgi:tetratricopeptide (TPR) repeat protein
VESERSQTRSEGTDGFLETPALEVAAQALAMSAAAAGETVITTSRSLPAAIGRYRIVRLLGEGGMGTVYEAEQEQPRRFVALKVIRPGLATPERLRRFTHEAQALGRLQHPGIAQIYEASTADTGLGPQPYFAMELIRGWPLHQYAAANQLNTQQRLVLMVKICEAVHHAHQRGVIHRDLKPGNIVVDESGQPKILDFGVSRVTESDAQATRQTDLGQIVGTLAYMSPEQVLADPLEVDTRSDVYSLGVILYELLSGRLPYDVNRRQLHEAAQTIREEDPTSLSSLSRHYRGDVETIVGKALEKDKGRRYASAEDLAADIQRYLSDEPITARPPSASYQLQKFARRHRAFVAGVTAVFVALVAGVAASTSQAIRANRAGQAALMERDRAAAARQTATEERDRALRAERNAVAAEAKAVQERNRALTEKQRADEESAAAKAISNFLQNDLLRQASLVEQGPNTRPDSDLKVRTALDRAAARIPGKFEGQPLVEASIRQAIGTTYLNLGLLPEAQTQMEKALELRRRALGEDHPDTAVGMNNLAVLYLDLGKISQAEPLVIKALEIRRRVLGEEDPITLVSLSNLGSLYRAEGKYEQAELAYLKAIEIRSRVLGANHRDTAMSMHNLALLYRFEGKNREGERLEIRTLEVFRSVLGEEHPVTLRSVDNLAALYYAEERYGEAEDLWNKVVEVRRRILGAQHSDTTDVMASLADAQLQEQKYVLAESVVREALSNWEKMNPDGWKPYYGQALLGSSLAGQKRYVEAEPLLVSGFQGMVQREAAVPPESRRVITQAGERIVQFYESWGKPEKAAEWAEKLPRNNQIH